MKIFKIIYSVNSFEGETYFEATNEEEAKNKFLKVWGINHKVIKAEEILD